MKRYSYSERDYAFGQAMLTLRTSISLTQAGLADLLGVSRRAVAEWEAGSSYPKADHLKQLVALEVQQQAFPVEREAEEIRTFWKAARQKMLLDESWLSTLLSQQHFVSQKSILNPAGKRSVHSSKFSDGPQLGIVLEREERSGQRRTLSSPCADPFFSACQSCLVARLSTQAARFLLSTKLPAFGFRSMQNTLA